MLMEPVMSRGERWGFVLLTALAGAATLGFGWYWFELGAAHRGVSWIFVVATLLLGFHLSSWFTRWLLLGRMRRPRPMAPVPGLRVAAVTFVPRPRPSGCWSSRSGP